MKNQPEIESDTTERPIRNIFLRILFGGIWFVFLYFIACVIVAFIMAAFANTSQYKSHAEVTNAASQAAQDFLQKYGLIFMLSYVVIFIVLCYFRLLPGVSKYKKSKQA